MNRTLSQSLTLSDVEEPPTDAFPRRDLGLLASLHPLRVAPSEFSTRTRMIMALRRIEFLRVVPTTNGPGYAIQVFCKSPQHHIPLAAYSNGRSLTTHPQWKKPNHTTLRSPDLVVHRRLVDLVKLHDDLFQLARLGHGLEPCSFCLGIITYCGYNRVKPQRSMTWMHRRETIAAKLSAYLNDLLSVVLKVKAFRSEPCAGQEKVPMVFYRFLQHATSRPSLS